MVFIVVYDQVDGRLFAQRLYGPFTDRNGAFRFRSKHLRDAIHWDFVSYLGLDVYPGDSGLVSSESVTQ